jgi:putative colanic acid biosynthesis acetyltransferase WcaF
MMPMTQNDPYELPAFSLGNRLLRAIWGVVALLLFRPSPRPFFGWRSFLLTLFGAEIGPGTHIYPSARIWAPWNLVCEDVVSIGDEVVVYNPRLLVVRSHAVVSHQAYLCGATHNYQDPSFPTIAHPNTLGAYSWVCARATVNPGVNLGDGAVLGTGSVAIRDLEPWGVYAGVPARKIECRPMREGYDVARQDR